ncbi:FkbM family methyltransferase [Acidicapsa acidisoli]|uniref:FkbM family methyltransferase n=1 Tax=Acidicapsa acidisoli TaxID=1615681 RepID=UPI0021DF4FB5|nr:FkbM family methyltransferase [Acidicapsa acidisoli]
MARTTFASAVHKLNTVKVGHRIADSRLAAWVCGEGAVVAKLRFGAQAVVFVNEYNGRSMYLWGEHDPRITAVINAVLRNGDTALDIGANFGVTGLLAAKRVGPAGTVHLFEPQPLVASCLRTSLLINGFANAVVHECALSDRKGSAAMTVLDTTNMGMTTLSPPNRDTNTPLRSFSVRTENAGEYVHALGCKKVALIKIDVEGHEAVVLASMKDWLSEVRPPVILFECHLNGGSFQEQHSVRILSELGYEFLGFDTKPLWHTRLYAINGMRHPVGYDFVAIRWQELNEDRRKVLEAMMARRDG